MQSRNGFDLGDIYEFAALLHTAVLQPIDKSHANYLEYGRLFGDQPMQMTPKLFLKACSFVKSSGLLGTSENCSIHQTMAPILRGLQKQGFHAVLTRETDFNDEVKPSARVSTSYAIGVFDKAGLDLLSLIPMKYSWLKRINPAYLRD